jgi:hypothetical protein
MIRYWYSAEPLTTSVAVKLTEAGLGNNVVDDKTACAVNVGMLFRDLFC